MPVVGQKSRKRPAISPAGPTPKKAHIEKTARRSIETTKADKRRARPITLPVKNDSETDSDEADEGGIKLREEEEEGEEEEDLDEGDESKSDKMLVDTAPPKDPNASRESHKAQRVLQEQRRAAKPYSTLLANAKSVWSQAQKKNLPPAERKKHIHDLMDIIRGNINVIVFKHDASRIVQTAVKWGGKKERDEVAVELKGKYVALTQNKYSKFLVTKLIRLSPNHRPAILLEFQSHVLRLLLHREASTVLADAYELHANAYERSILLRDFYGKETALFSITTGSDEDKERAKKGLKGVLEGVEDERRKRVLASLKTNLINIFNHPDKGAVTHAIVHQALLEYLMALNDLNDGAEREKLRREIFESCQDILAEMVHTKDGSRVVREFIAQGSAKDRKQIVKVLKPHVQRMCTDEEAQLVLFTALDVIDDTKLTAKSLLSDITTHARTLYKSPQGRRAILYLLIPRTRRHFTPVQIGTLEETDALRARTSKKDSAVRADEVRKAASEGLLAFMEEMGSDVARDPGGSLVAVDIMLFAEDCSSKNVCMEKLLKALLAQYPSTDESAPHAIDLPHTSRLYKTLLQGGHYSHTTKSISLSPSFSPSAFATAFVKIVGRERTLAMSKGNGAFVVAELCERIREDGSDEERTMLRGWFNDEVMKEVMAGDAKGKNVLMEKVATLSNSSS